MKCQCCGKEVDTLYPMRKGDFCKDCILSKYGQDTFNTVKPFPVEDCKIPEEKEMVQHPIHYGGDTPYECIKVLKEWLSPEEYKGFCRGNTLKYLCRVGKKDEAVQEYKKARFYLDKLIEVYEKE